VHQHGAHHPIPTSHWCSSRLRSGAGHRDAGGERAARRRRGHRDLGRPGRCSSTRCDPWLRLDGERYRTIDVPGATRTEAWDITNRGDVIGYYANADGRLHGFRLDKRGKYTKFDDPDGDLENDLTGGNDRGVTVGSLLRYDPTMGEAHGYLRDARGRVTTIDVPGALTTLAWRINNRGQVDAPIACKRRSGGARWSGSWL
jgi:hypothetical protein